MSVRCCKICVVCSKVNFITNITNSTRIHTFYFYNKKHIYINTDTTFTTKHTNLSKSTKVPWRDLSVPPKILFTHLSLRLFLNRSLTMKTCNLHPWVLKQYQCATSVNICQNLQLTHTKTTFWTKIEKKNKKRLTFFKQVNG